VILLFRQIDGVEVVKFLGKGGGGRFSIVPWEGDRDSRGGRGGGEGGSNGVAERCRGGTEFRNTRLVNGGACVSKGEGAVSRGGAEYRKERRVILVSLR